MRTREQILARLDEVHRHPSFTDEALGRNRVPDEAISCAEAAEVLRRCRAHQGDLGRVGRGRDRSHFGNFKHSDPEYYRKGYFYEVEELP